MSRTMTILTMKISIFKEENTMENNADFSKMEKTTTGAKRNKIIRLKKTAKQLF